MSNKSYVTTPIYYVNDVAHIGHAYTTVITDTLARYFRLRGDDTFFLTGTDEHGQKIEQSAKQRGKDPKEYADTISATFKNLWDDFEISYDKFIRTTDEEHKIGVQKAFEIMMANGDIYKDVYKGNYCVSCETFFTQKQLIDEEFCPDCGKPTSVIEEESYFFKLSKYEDKLLQHYRENEDFILPRQKRNEIMRFVEGGLNDLSVTRTSFEWGVKLPQSVNDPKHVMYVWLDALMNYVTALGYGGDEKDMDHWPAQYHLIGKDILRFHAVYWPAFLMSLGLPLPKHIAAHGWWTRDGQKMSKSKGNVVDPKEVADAYGVENFRYFMMREVPFGQDGDFSQKALIDRINSDLGNDLGNLLNRVIGMSHKYFDGNIHSENIVRYYPDEIAQIGKQFDSIEELMTSVSLNRFLEELWKPLSIANRSIDKYQPWVMMKESKEKEAMALIALIANIIAKVSVLLHPFMPQTTQKIATALSLNIDTQTYKKLIKECDMLPDFVIQKVPPLFPRIEEELLKNPEDEQEQEVQEDNLITIDQFFASEIKVGTVIKAEEVEGSSKLLLLQVDIGESKPRQVVAGIKKYYSAKELLEMQVCVVSNLKPAKLMGLESQGMILAAKDKKGLALICPQTPRKEGSKVG
ncbi:MAG: methionine--tRNA ligase [Campylobacterota bacterium]